MKTIPAIARNVLLVAALLLLAGCACFPFFWECFGCRRLELKPSAKISKQKWDEIRAVLHRSNPALYRIQYYQDGVLQPRRTEGALPEASLRNGLAEEVASEARKTSYTGHALQAGFGNSSTHQKVDAMGTSQTKPKMTGNSSTLQKADCEGTATVVDALENILHGFHK